MNSSFDMIIQFEQNVEKEAISKYPVISAIIISKGANLLFADRKPIVLTIDSVGQFESYSNRVPLFMSSIMLTNPAM